MRRCVEYGFGIGCMYAIAQSAAAGLGVDFAAEVGFNLPTAIVLDLSLGALGGFIAGALMPFVRGSATASGAAAVSLFPSVCGFALAENGISRETVISSAIASLFIGLLAGVFVWKRYGP